MGAERRIGLDLHLVGAAEPVEVVHVQRAQVDLHGVEHIRDRHAQLLGLDAVQVGVELRHVDLVARERRAQLRRLARLLHEGLRGGEELLVADRAAVFQLHLEAAHRAEALHRRRREHGDERILDGAVLLVQLAGDGATRQVGRLALVERLERDEHDAGARAVGEAVDRQAREGHGAFHAGVLQGDVRHAADHVLGAVQRGAVGQLREAHQVLLVLHRHEAARHAVEQQRGQADQRQIDAQHDGLAADHARCAAAIRFRRGTEHAVERAEDPTQAAFHHTRQQVLRRVMALEQQRGQRRRQRERVERGDDRRDRDRQRELLVELAGQARHEGQRHEHGDQRQRDGDDGAAHLAHGLVGGLARRQPVGDVALDVLHHHDGVIHHDPDRQHQPEQRQRVDREAEHQHQPERADDGHRHRQQRNDRRAPSLQEQDHHQHHQRHRFEQRVRDRLDARADELRRVIDDAVVHAFGKVFLQLGHRLAHVVRNLQRVGARRLEDRNGHRLLVVQQRAQAVFRRGQLDAGHVAQGGHRAVGRALEDDVAEFLLGLQAPLRIDGQLQVRARQRRRAADHAGRHLHVLVADGAHHFIGGQAALGHLVRVEPHAHRVVARAEQLHLAHAVDARQAVLDVEHRVVAQVRHVVAVVGRQQVDHHRQVGAALDGGHAQALHHVGQARHGLRDAVLHQLLGLVRVGAQLEGHRHGQVAVAVGLRLHVEHVLDAVDLLFERRGDGLGDHLGVGARKLRAHHHRRRHDLGVLRDRQSPDRDDPDQQDQRGKHPGEDGAVHEEFGEVHGVGR